MRQSFFGSNMDNIHFYDVFRQITTRSIFCVFMLESYRSERSCENSRNVLQSNFCDFCDFFTPWDISNAYFLIIADVLQFPIFTKS